MHLLRQSALTAQCPALQPPRESELPLLGHHTGVTDASVVYLDSNLVLLRRGNLDVFDGQILAGLPGNGGLAGDYLGWKPTSRSVDNNFRARLLQSATHTFPAVGAEAMLPDMGRPGDLARPGRGEDETGRAAGSGLRAVRGNSATERGSLSRGELSKGVRVTAMKPSWMEMERIVEAALA